MAREYAQTKISMWDDDSEFLDLAPFTKLLYIHLYSRRDLSHAGHLIIREQRWAHACFNGNTDPIGDAITELITKRYVVIDSKTGELLIRTFILHDGGWRNPKMRKAIAGSVDKIESVELSTIARRSLANCVASIAPPANHQVERQHDHQSDSQSDHVSDQEPDSTYHLPPAPTTLNLQPAAAPTDPPDTSTERKPNAAAAALKMLIDHKCKTAKTAGLRIQLQRDLPDEHRDAISAYIATRPNATAQEIASVVLGVPDITFTPAEVKQPWYADPYCAACPGDGWQTITILKGRTESRELVPCNCRRAEPYIATVTPIRPQGATDV